MPWYHKRTARICTGLHTPKRTFNRYARQRSKNPRVAAIYANDVLACQDIDASRV